MIVRAKQEQRPSALGCGHQVIVVAGVTAADVGARREDGPGVADVAGQNPGRYLARSQGPDDVRTDSAGRADDKNSH